MSRLRTWLRRRRARVPQDWDRYVRHINESLNGIFPRMCNMCGYKGMFRAFGHPPRFDVHCPQCDSLDRHRLIALWLAGGGEARVSGKDVLHVAPEPHVAKLLEPRAARYVPSSYDPDKPEAGDNIEALPYPDESFDLVVCSHVLEHVDDAAALGEIARILRPGGTALVMLPVIEGWDETYENPAPKSSRERLLHFGQWDHVRYHGRDIRERIAAAGFGLEEFTAVEPFVSRHGLTRGEKVFVCTRRAAG